ncbi:MAG: SMI1/KNR4 family protein [Alteromonadales bacterium]|nr:SMI1/KNR4 family protein [Alteromonadales bacterium]
MNERFNRIIQLFRDNSDSNFSIDQASVNEIESVENELGVKLPDSYCAFQLKLGDFDEGFLDIYSVRSPQDGNINIAGITRMEQNECEPKMPQHLIPFSDNGGGDSYCFDTSDPNKSECRVVFWDHTASEDQKPEIVACDFLEWIENEIMEL